MSWQSRVFLSGQAVPLLVLGLTRSPLISALLSPPTVVRSAARLAAG